jgi:hypothetical protein
LQYQAAILADQVASGALVSVATSQLRSERKRLEDKIERLRMQHTEVVRDKSVAKNKSWNLLDKVGMLEKDNEDLSQRLNEKYVVAEANTEAQAARAEALAAQKRTVELELEVKNMCAYRGKVEAATWVGVDRAHTLFVDAYRGLGGQTTPLKNQKGRWGPASSGGCRRSWSSSCLS